MIESEMRKKYEKANKRSLDDDRFSLSSSSSLWRRILMMISASIHPHDFRAFYSPTSCLMLIIHNWLTSLMRSESNVDRKSFHLSFCDVHTFIWDFCYLQTDKRCATHVSNRWPDHFLSHLSFFRTFSAIYLMWKTSCDVGSCYSIFPCLIGKDSSVILFLHATSPSFPTLCIMMTMPLLSYVHDAWDAFSFWLVSIYFFCIRWGRVSIDIVFFPCGNFEFFLRTFWRVRFHVWVVACKFYRWIPSGHHMKHRHHEEIMPDWGSS